MVHDNGTGGGEPHPSMLTKMKYVSSLGVAECEALGIGDVHQGGGAKN